ncbi:MAG: GNAT family N-acetyltransferase [Clostridia bacterium]|nr:GNAT family N-acetyltransferase [Clostridia bacterium]
MIRKMTLSDYAAVFDLWMSTPHMGLRTLDDSEEGITLFLRRNPETCFVAVEGAEVIGVILCGHDGRRGYIYHTVVHPDHRKQGLGTALIDAAVAALQKEGITRVCLNVMESNEAGKQFWKKRGWEKKDFLGFYSKSITKKENLPLFKEQ